MLFRRVGHQRRNRHTVADAEDIRRYRIIGFFLVEDVLLQPRAAPPAILLWQRDARETALELLGDSLARAARPLDRYGLIG